ncbi:MAG: ArnT family glycosyltransferase [bacterium]
MTIKHVILQQTSLWMRSIIFVELSLVLALFFAFFFLLGVPPLFDLDEGAFSSATWEMLERQDFITVYSNGELRFDKPILIYWLQSLSVSWLGLNEFALRLPSALAASLWVFALFYFVRGSVTLAEPAQQVTSLTINQPNVIALLSAFLLMNAFMVIIIGRAATADAVLNLLIALSLFDIYRYFALSSNKTHHQTQIQSKQTTLIYRVYLWLGLGLLCKGPIAIFVPFAASLLFALWNQQWRLWLSAILHLRGWLLMLVVAAPWYWLAYQAQGQLFIDGFFLKHNVSRFSDTMENHGGSLFYYIPVIFLVLMPFGGWLIQLFIHIKQTLKQPLDRFLWSWFFVVFVFFSFSNTQLPHYLLYGMTPLFILLARYHHYFRWRWLSVLPALLFALLLVFLPDLFAYQAEQAQHNLYLKALFAHAGTVFDSYYRAAAIGLFIVIVGIGFWRALPQMWAMLFIGVAQTLFLVTLLLPSYAAIQQQPIKNAAQFAKENLQHERIVMWHLNMPSFIVYRQQITPKQTPQYGDIVYTRLDKLAELGRHQVLFSQGGIVLARKLDKESVP